MSYNIYKGGQARLDTIANVVNVCRPDIIGFCEANNWAEDGAASLRFIQEKNNLQNKFFCKANTQYDLALLSKTHCSENFCIQDGLWHAALGITFLSPEVGEVMVILVHLDPRSEDARLREINLILSRLSSKKNLIIMGDFNALSPEDNYSEKTLTHLKKKKIFKFGKENLRFDVIRALNDAGMSDVMLQNRTSVTFSVPTEVRDDVMHALPLRLDYMFVSQSLTSKITSAFFYNEGEAKKASDHFPLVVNLEID